MLQQLATFQQYTAFTSFTSVIPGSSCTFAMAPKRQHSASAHSAAVKLEAKPEVKLELTAADVKEELQEQVEALSQRPSRRAKLEPKADAEVKAASPAKRVPRKKAVKPEEITSKASATSSTDGGSSSSSVSVFPSWPAPTPERCAEVHEALVQLHGAPLRTKLAETGTDLEKPASTQLVSTYCYYFACYTCQHRPEVDGICHVLLCDLMCRCWTVCAERYSARTPQTRHLLWLSRA
jgi:hypothetical protein